MKTGAIGLNMPNGRYGQSFLGSKFFLQEGPKISQSELDREASQAQKARDGGVSVPKYKTKENKLHVEHIRYETKGDAANIKTNPIRLRHLRSLFKNLYFMDRIGILHNNLSPKHIFLQDDRQVEFDFFRDSINFYQRHSGTISQSKSGSSISDSTLPSNEESFKRGYLSKHIAAIDDSADKTFFMKQYLDYSGEYHQKRAELLAKNRMYETLGYETTLSEVYMRPSRRVVSFEIDKLNAEKQMSDALLKWSQEEDGNKREAIDPMTRFDSILMQFECVKTMANLKDVAQYFSENSMTAQERKYFKFEEERIQKRLDDVFCNAADMGASTFFDPENNISLGYGDEKDFFLELCKEADLTCGQKAGSTIKDIQEYYSALKDRWDKGLNKSLMEEHQSL